MKLGVLVWRKKEKSNLNRLHEKNSHPLLLLVVISVIAGFAAVDNRGGANLAWGQAGVYAKPWIAYGKEFDDNVFNDATGRKSDVVTRFTPGLEFGYRSEPFTLLGRYDFDAEIFAKNTKLTQAQARQRGGIQFDYKPTRF